MAHPAQTKGSTRNPSSGSGSVFVSFYVTAKSRDPQGSQHDCRGKCAASGKRPVCGSCSQCLPDWAKLCRAYAALMGQKSRQVRFQDSGGVHRTPRTGDAGATAEKATSKGKEPIFKFQISNGSVDVHAEVQVSCASEGSFESTPPRRAGAITKRWQATALQISGGRRRLGCCHSGKNLP